MKNKFLAGVLVVTMAMSMLVGCGASSDTTGETSEAGNEVNNEVNNEAADLERAKTLYDEGLDLVYGATPDFDKAYDKFIEAAELGYNDAYYYVANLYKDIYPTEKDDKVLELYLKNEENPLSQVRIASLYRWSEDIAKDEAKADEYAKKAADAGAPEADSYYASVAYYEHDYDKYVELLNNLIDNPAEQGFKSSAMLSMSSCYYRGFGVEQNYETSVEWYIKAAELNNVGAMAELADKYMTGGRGVDQNIDTAVEWAEKAANLHSSYAMITLGSIYANDNYGRPDYEKAFEWFKKSADQDYKIAQFYTAMFYRNGKGVDADRIKALEYMKKAAEHAEYGFSLGGEVQDWNAMIMFTYGDMLFDDMINYDNSTKTSKEEVLKWIGLARDAGHEDAIKYYDGVKNYLDKNF